MKMLFKGNSSRLELLIEKIQSTKENEFKVPVASASGSNSSRSGFEADAETQPEESSNTSNGPYKCPICGENFIKERQLRDHEQSHTDHLQFTCQFCPRLFKHKRSRDRHTKLHTGDKKYKCQQCESAFSRSDHLKIHMKTHDSRKPYKCGTCNRGYNTAAALSSHQQSHLKQESRSGSRASGESTPSPGIFRCNHCSESFGKQDLLQNHMSLIHSDSDTCMSQASDHTEFQSRPPPLSQQIDEVKIVCMYCSKDFSNLELMYQHVAISHSDVQNGLSSSTNLNSIHLPQPDVFPSTSTSPTYACERCTMQFDSVEGLKNHTTVVHWKPLSPNLMNYMVPAINLDKSYSPCQTQPTDLSRKTKIETTTDSDVSNNKKIKIDASPAPSPYDGPDKPCICSCCYAQLPNFKAFLLHMESHMISSTTQILGFCPVCGEPSRDKTNFAAHVFSHAITQVPGQCCYICKKVVNNAEDLQKHLFDFHVVQIFKCAICSELFDSKLSIQIHMTNKHTDECKHYKCYLCSNQLFHDKISAEVHLSMKHFQQFIASTSPINSQPVLNTQYQMELTPRISDYTPVFHCDFCQKTFKDRYTQYMHILKEHNENTEALNPSLALHRQTPSRSPNFVFPKFIVSPNGTTNVENNDSVQIIICEICNRNFSNENDLINHKKLHHTKSSTKVGPVSLQCAYCNEYCKSRSDLENHMKTHQVTCGKGKHKCNICDEIFSSTLTLADHKLSHCKIVEGNNCVQCKSILTDELSFYTHQLKHSNNPKANSQISLPANCIICCQTLQTDVEIKLHAKFHLKHLIVKEYMCGVCSKIYDGQTGQIVERTGSNPTISLCKECKNNSIDGNEFKTSNTSAKFACIQCPQTFATETDIKAHATMHMINEGTNFECRLCRQVFPSPLKLQTHLIEHNFYGMNQYSCYVCSSVFTAASGLQNHIVSHGLECRPYECSNCQMKFFFRAELDNHIFIHITPEQNYLLNGDIYDTRKYVYCKYCSTTFLDNTFYQKHLKTCSFNVAKQEIVDPVDNKIKEEKQDDDIIMNVQEQ